jgi:hypothetical protein
MIIDFPYVCSRSTRIIFHQLFTLFDYQWLSSFLQRLGELAQIFFLFLTLV